MVNGAVPTYYISRDLTKQGARDVPSNHPNQTFWKHEANRCAHRGT
jgi:hypothetical protein